MSRKEIISISKNRGKEPMLIILFYLSSITLGNNSNNDSIKKKATN
jgi:hypothetical protein